MRSCVFLIDGTVKKTQFEDFQQFGHADSLRWVVEVVVEDTRFGLVRGFRFQLDLLEHVTYLDVSWVCHKLLTRQPNVTSAILLDYVPKNEKWL